jgi:hypothetical protein
MLRLERESTHQVTRLEVQRGDVQIVPFVGHLGIDVQAVNRRVDAHTERQHAYLILSHAEARAVVERITSMLDVEAEPVGQAVLPFRRRAA